MRFIPMLARAVAVALSAAGAVAVAADDFPSRPVRIVMPAPPGGSGDAVMRSLIPRMSEKLGQAIVIDNKPGAGGNIGMELVARAAPDGYVIGVAPAGPMAVNASLYPKLPYDPAKDFAPIGAVAMTPFVFVGNPAFPARTLKEVIAAAERTPGKIGFAHGGNGTAMHLSLQLLSHKTGARFLEVPYKGTGAAASDVLAGHSPLAVLDLPAALALINAGKLIAYAVTSPRRVSALPNVPTVAEAGVPQYESTGWFGLVAPAATPPVVIAKLQDALADALAQPQFREKALALGIEPRPENAQEFGRFIQNERQKWSEVIKALGTKLD